MKTIIITAHPSSKGFTHRIAESYRKGAEEKGNAVTIIDLYAEAWKQDYFQFEDIGNLPPDPKRDKMQALIREADELVFIHPMWWWSMPAIMKNFIDTNFQSGFAYRYKKVPILKGMPVGLLKGKKARVFITSDSPKWFFLFFMTPIKRIWSTGILYLFGIKCRSFTMFDRMRWRSEEKKEKWLDKVYQLGKK